jgi:hypothetical protein
MKWSMIKKVLGAADGQAPRKALKVVVVEEGDLLVAHVLDPDGPMVRIPLGRDASAPNPRGTGVPVRGVPRTARQNPRGTAARARKSR